MRPMTDYNDGRPFTQPGRHTPGPVAIRITTNDPHAGHDIWFNDEVAAGRFLATIPQANATAPADQYIRRAILITGAISLN